MTQTAAVVAAIALVALSLFQIALALGAPWGAAAFGGSNPGVLPTRLRITSAVAGLVVYPFIALFILDAGGILDIGLAGESAQLWMWVLTGLFAFGTLLNLISRSKVERWWAAVSAIIAICCAQIASSI